MKSFLAAKTGSAAWRRRRSSRILAGAGGPCSGAAPRRRTCRVGPGVERGMRGNDEIRARLHRLLQHRERCHRRCGDAGDDCRGIARLESIDGLGLPLEADVLLDAIDQVLRGDRGAGGYPVDRERRGRDSRGERREFAAGQISHAWLFSGVSRCNSSGVTLTSTRCSRDQQQSHANDGDCLPLARPAVRTVQGART